MSGSLQHHYRDATIQDAAAIGAFLQERFAATFGHLYPPADLAAFNARSYTPAAISAALADPACADRLVVAGETILAVAQIGPMGLPLDAPATEHAYELKRLYLADSVKGAGVADSLMAWATARAAAYGARALYLSVWSENYRAQRFYARHGFQKCGAYLFPVGETLDDEWILRVDLK